MKQKLLPFMLILLFSISGQAYSQIVSAGSGNWSETTSWVGGVVPAAGQSVLVDAGHTIYVNTAAECLNLHIKGTVGMDSTTSRSLSVFGNLLVDTTGTLRMYNTANTGGSTLIHQLTFYKSLFNYGVFDMRTGSNPAVGVGDITITGNDTTYMRFGAYSSSNNEFNRVTINKTGTAPIVLLSDVNSNNNSTTAPSALVLTRGIIITGDFGWYNRSSSSAVGVLGGSDSSYVRGSLIRFIASGSNISRLFAVGDTEYRPVTVVLPTGISNAPIKVKLVSGNANTGASTFQGNIEAVSTIRYYEITNLHTAALNFTFFTPTYREGDYVTPGNQQLRVATALDNRNVWIDRGPDSLGIRPHMTSITGSAVSIMCDSIAGGLSLAANQVVCLSLARVTGSVYNPLPVELNSFSASVTGSTVTLNWQTASETNNHGFFVQRENGNGWTEVSFIKGLGSSVKSHAYSFSEEISSGLYNYRLVQTDFNGTVKIYGPIEVNVSTVPVQFTLSEAYPNPFNPSANINFSVAEHGQTQLRLISITGEVISSLFNETAEPGIQYSVRIDGSRLSSGVYFAILTQGVSRSIKSIVLTK